MFHQAILSGLRYAETYGHEDIRFWLAPWMGILTTLFPVEQGFLLKPTKIINRKKDHINIIEVTRLVKLPSFFQTILYLQLQYDAEAWRACRKGEILDVDFEGVLKLGFEQQAADKAYWITVNGPRWRFGKASDSGEEIEPLSKWHAHVKDDESYKELQELSKLVYEACRGEIEFKIA